MELTAQKPGMIVKFDYLHQLTVRGGAADNKAVLRQLFPKSIIELVAVPMPFVKAQGFVGLGGQGIFLENAGVGPQAHGAAFIGRTIPADYGLPTIIKPLPHQIDYRMGIFRIKLFTLGVSQTGNVSGKFNNCQLHAETDAEIGNLVYPGIFDGLNFAFHAAIAKTSGHQDTVAVDSKESPDPPVRRLRNRYNAD